VDDDHRAGTGNWSAFARNMNDVHTAAEDWKRAVAGIEKPWLCWNINDEWCAFQQKIILSVGWTPVIGWDPSCNPGKRTVFNKSVEIDFNKSFSFDSLWPHFPLEFAFLWTKKLAFWHADLLLRINKLRKLVELFESIEDGDMAAVESKGGLRNILSFRTHRYWELLGCTTQKASKHQFDTGCGWWRHFYLHPNTPIEERHTRAKYYYDSGVGIMYWKRRYKKNIYSIKEKWASEGHCTQINNPHYQSGKNKGEELNVNFSIEKVAERLDLLGFLGP